MGRIISNYGFGVTVLTTLILLVNLFK
jgi:hypothetical protein